MSQPPPKRTPPAGGSNVSGPNKKMIECPWCHMFTRAFDTCSHCNGPAFPIIKRGPNKTEKPKIPKGGRRY